MTDQITVPRETWDALRGALDTIIQYNRDHAACQYGDAEKAERWACVVKAREAITAANAVKPQAHGEALPVEGSEASDNAIHAMLCERQWPSSSMNAARAGWRAARLFTHPQATEPALTEHERRYADNLTAMFRNRESKEAIRSAMEPEGWDSLMEKAYERGWIECACWANRDDLRADVGSPAYLADRAPHLDAVKNGWPLGCEKCIDPDGIPCFPQYGVGPHTCFYKIPGAKVGESQPLPKDQWPDNYREDPDCPGMGVYWCPHCGSGKPAPEAKQ